MQTKHPIKIELNSFGSFVCALLIICCLAIPDIYGRAMLGCVTRFALIEAFMRREGK